MKLIHSSLILALFLNTNQALRMTSLDEDPQAENLKNQVKDMVEVLGKRNSVTDMKIAVLEAEKQLNNQSATPSDPPAAAKQPEPAAPQPVNYKEYYEADQRRKA